MSLVRPALKLQEFFDGTTSGWGYTHSRRGKISQQFDITAEGQWDVSSQTLRLREAYNFDDGHHDLLEWRITKLSEKRYSGREEQLVGKAEGDQANNQFRWRYVRDVPQSGGGTTRLSFDDVFYLQEPKVLLARASVTRFGFEVGIINVTYLKA